MMQLRPRQANEPDPIAWHPDLKRIILNNVSGIYAITFFGIFFNFFAQALERHAYRYTLEEMFRTFAPE